ncbi:acyltransferase [Xanthobacter sp. 126]|uniref:acyltransferase family protein n=1 Tax=Xanthobacter sp. 126 TaxID=1131814 RepID=UPI00045E5FC4|nr:acyltransferase [Xanthobacter sp. 126]
MKYRSEVDGLRAFAVMPVIFFHAGFWPFTGGYIGVDIFFVISGYLITSILIKEVATDSYSILRFYERRARRILPALFLVMGVTAVFCYFFMLPDELKRFGQSVVATTLFSNNILLTLTSGYWDMDSEFKPLLHTWSLGVEEQYYILFPLYIYAGWKLFPKALAPSLAAIGVASLVLACWSVTRHPDAAFYLLPTRAWELLIGSIAAFVLQSRDGAPLVHRFSQPLSLLGLIMVAAPSVVFTPHTPMPSLWTLIPTAGAALVIVFAHNGTLANRILSLKVLVGIGLVSYSAYLWHNPLFVLARIYSPTPPSYMVMAILTVLTMILAYFSWKYVERPFRTKGLFGQRSIFAYSAAASVVFIAMGGYLNFSLGIPSRMYSAKNMQFDDIFKSYNQGAFKYKVDSFPDNGKLNILIIGNSFGRDFVNMVRETFNVDNVNVVYRDDTPDCFSKSPAKVDQALVNEANVIFISKDVFEPACVAPNLDFVRTHGKKLFYIGTKHFGANLNWLIRLPLEERKNQYNTIPPEALALEQEMSVAVPPANFISLMAPIRKGETIPITDADGHLLSPDRVHLTRQGAIFLGARALRNSSLATVLTPRSASSD